MAKRYLTIINLVFFISVFSSNCFAISILQYHHISTETPFSTSVSKQRFEAHMVYLADNNFNVLSLPEVIDALKNKLPLPDKAVVITFDDGYVSVYENAFPILKRRGWPFTVFINAKPIDQQLHSQFVSWDQLRDMAKSGATIANHSYSHPHFLRQLDGENTQQWRTRIAEELHHTETRLKEEVGQTHKLLAYPYGEYNAMVKKVAVEEGYVAFGQQSGPVGPNSDLQALPRFPFGGVYGEIEDFAVKAASLPMALKSVQVLSSKGNKPLSDTVLPQGEARPRLRLELSDAKIASRVQCFASGQGDIPTSAKSGVVEAQAEKPLPVGRSRYNCTVQSETQGRFYWHSEFFIRKQPDGTWYPED